MTPSDFIRALRAQVVDELQERYRETFANIDVSRIRSQESSAAIEWFRMLPPEQQEIFLSWLRRSAVDTISSLLGILDGVSCLPPFNKGFALSTGDGLRLDGDLSGFFLEAEELDNRRTTSQ